MIYFQSYLLNLRFYESYEGFFIRVLNNFWPCVFGSGFCFILSFVWLVLFALGFFGFVLFVGLVFLGGVCFGFVFLNLHCSLK